MSESTPVTEYKTLYAALVAAQRAAQAVAKSSKNSFHGYKYASAEAIVEEAKDALNSCGLAFIATGWKVEMSSVPKVEFVANKPDAAPKETEYHSKIVVQYKLVHAASGGVMEFQSETSIIPEKGRPQDKAEATALTYNLGYSLRGLLQIGREDPATSVDARNDVAKEPPTTPVETAEVVKLLSELAAVKTMDELKTVHAAIKAQSLTKNQKIVAAFKAKSLQLSPAPTPEAAS